MAANIKEIADGGPNPNTPTVKEMRESQRKGSIGKGLQVEDYADQEAVFNVGTGQDGGGDKPSYPRWSNDELVAEYPDGE